MAIPDRFPNNQNDRIRDLMAEFANECPKIIELRPHIAMALKLHVAFARYEEELNGESPVRRTERALAELIASLENLPNTYAGLFGAIGADDKLDAMMRLKVILGNLERHHGQQPFSRPRGKGRPSFRQADDLILALADFANDAHLTRTNSQNELGEHFANLLDTVFESFPKNLKPKDVRKRARVLLKDRLRIEARGGSAKGATPRRTRGQLKSPPI